MKKNYVLDANVLLHDPNAVFKFEDNDVIIPIYAIEEIDQFKRETSERGRNARSIARVLDELRGKDGSLSQAVRIKQGGTLRIALPKQRHELPVGLNTTSLDHAILQTAIEIQNEDKAVPTVFVTMDTNLRIRADALGMATQTYENPRVREFDLEQSMVERLVAPAEIDGFFSDGWLKVEEDTGMYPNAGVLLRDNQAPNHTALARWDDVERRIVALRAPREGVMGIRPRNKEQAVALDLLLDDAVGLVALLGKAGTGKTLLALAAGLQRLTIDHAYSRMLVSRPVMPLGRDLGFLPGDVDEKLNPWMQPIFDNLDYIYSNGAGPGRETRSYLPLVESGVIQVEPLTYIRGRSLPKQYLIVDEAQNLTPHEVKTILTRSGEGTKVVFTGDPHQIDHPYVDDASNGLAVVAQRFKHERLAGHVVMIKGERSELAELAADVL